MRIYANKPFARIAIQSLCTLSCCSLLALTIAGCGGGSSSPSPTASASPTPSPSPTVSPTAARVVIAWGPRTRVVGLSSSLSARIVLSGAKASDGSDIVINANRPDGTGAPSQTYVSDSIATVGKPFHLTVTFYAEADQKGIVVGTAEAAATVLADGSLDTTIATYGTIRSVAIDPNQTVIQGSLMPLRFAPLDANGNLVAIAPGAAIIKVVSGTDQIRVEDESIRGVKPGTGTVTVTVDQGTSAETPITVTSDTQVTPNVSSLTLSILQSFTFSASVTGSNVPDTSVTYALVGAPSDVTLTDGKLTAGRTEGPFSVTVTSNYDPSKVVTIPVTIASKVKVDIAPNPVAVAINNKVQLGATVSDPDGAVSDTSVTWKIVDKASGTAITDGSGGTISTAGLYTAPNKAGIYRVVATSVYDTRKSGYVDVDVRAGTVGVVVE